VTKTVLGLVTHFRAEPRGGAWGVGRELQMREDLFEDLPLGERPWSVWRADIPPSPDAAYGVYCLPHRRDLAAACWSAGLPRTS
jgi:hypothetical protein